MDSPTAADIIHILESHGHGDDLAVAVAIAQETHPLLQHLIDSYGIDSTEASAAVTAVADKLADMAIGSANHATVHYARQIQSLPARSESAAALARDWAARLAGCDKVLEYASRLPMADAQRTADISLQRHRLDTLIRQLSRHASSHAGPHASRPIGAAAPTPSVGEAIATSPKTPPAESADAAGATQARPSSCTTQPQAKPHGWLRPLTYILMAMIAAAGVIYAVRIYALQARLDKIRADYTEEAITDYIMAHGDGHYGRQAATLYLEQMDSILLNPQLMQQPSQYPPLVRMDNLARSESLNADIRAMIAQRVRQRSDSLYRHAATLNTMESWHRYQDQAPSRYYRDSSERLDSLDTIAWGSEPTAWEAAQAAADKEGYTRYTGMYPQGAHSAEAQARLIDLEVNAYRNRGNSAIQSIDRVASFHDGESLVYIYNETAYDMEFMFSGPTSRKMAVPSSGSNSVPLADGPYRVLVIIGNPRHERFSFTQDMEGGIYSSSISFSEAE